MPRQPTARGWGRPKGSGELGEQIRLTVRIPLALYERLAAFAEGRSYTRGAPQLAVCVREALVAYLDNKGQTENIPLPQEENNRQTENVPKRAKGNYWQTKKVLPVGRQVRGARSELSGRILALLRSYPQGLTASELRVYLKAEKPIGDTLQGMVRTGKLRGVGRGQQQKYVLA